MNLLNRRIEVYSDPSGPDVAPRYRQQQDYGLEDNVPLAIGGHPDSIPVKELLE